MNMVKVLIFALVFNLDCVTVFPMKNFFAALKKSVGSIKCRCCCCCCCFTCSTGDDKFSDAGSEDPRQPLLPDRRSVETTSVVSEYSCEDDSGGDIPEVVRSRVSINTTVHGLMDLDEFGQTALHRLVKAGDVDALKRLLLRLCTDCGLLYVQALLKQKNAEGKTLLQYARDAGQEALVTFLEQYLKLRKV